MEMLYIYLSFIAGFVIGVILTAGRPHAKDISRERTNLLEAGVCMSGQRLLDIARSLPGGSATKICVILCAEQLRWFCEEIEAQTKKDLN